MKRTIYIFVCAASLHLAAVAQPAIQWQYSYGGTLNDIMSNGNNTHDQMALTADGGIIIAGLSESNDGDVTGHHGLSSTKDCWVIKLDSVGNLEWQRSLGGSQDEYSQCIRQTNDGGYILSANTRSSDGDVTGYHGSAFDDVWIVKLDSLGNIEWEHAYGGTSGDLGRSICQTYDGGFLMAGQTASNDSDVVGNHGSSDIWMVKLDANGVFQWQKCLGGSSGDGAYTVRATADHGFIMVGETSSTDGDLAGSTITPLGSTWLVKTDSLGNIEWNQLFGGPSLDWGREVYPTPDGGYIVGISTGSNTFTAFHGGLDYLLVKVDSAGNLQWEHCYGGTSSELLKAARPTVDGGFIVCGTTLSADGDITNNHGVVDAWVVKIDSLGTIAWQRSFGGSQAEDATSILETPDGGILFTGESYSNDGDVSGHHGATSSGDFWVVKLAPAPTGIALAERDQGSVTVWPVPVKDVAWITITPKHRCRVTLKILDIAGREVANLLDKELNPLPNRLAWDVTEGQPVSNGLYVVQVTMDGFVSSHKILVNR
jgi:hypothetical protein